MPGFYHTLRLYSGPTLSGLALLHDHWKQLLLHMEFSILLKTLLHTSKEDSNGTRCGGLVKLRPLFPYLQFMPSSFSQIMVVINLRIGTNEHFFEVPCANIQGVKKSKSRVSSVQSPVALGLGGAPARGTGPWRCAGLLPAGGLFSFF
jgi:hypothetical protein